MSDVILAQRCKMGSTTYYVATMKAGQLIRTVGFASELPNWDDMSIDEKIQRSLADDRVRSEIVPYLQRDPDRFFGSLIVDIYKGWETLKFEPLREVKGLQSAYVQALQDREFGFLVLPASDYLVALDGQHRLKALWYAIRGDSQYSIKAMPELREDDVTVLFVPHEDTSKIRNIFNKVNRYARQTSRGDNIITAEDDAFAILARRMISGSGILDAELVNWKSNTLSKRSLQLTTISTIYETIQNILEGHEELQGKVKVRPTEDQLDDYYEEIHEVWDAVLSGLDCYRNLSGDYCKNLREVNLLFRPIGQVAMFKGLLLACKLGRLNYDEAVRRLNSRVDWNIRADHWLHILVKPDGGMIAKQENKDLGGDLVAYLIAKDEMDKEWVQRVAAKYATKRAIRPEGRSPYMVLPQPLQE